jgi:hypothetical protein
MYSDHPTCAACSASSRACSASSAACSIVGGQAQGTRPHRGATAGRAPGAWIRLGGVRSETRAARCPSGGPAERASVRRSVRRGAGRHWAALSWGVGACHYCDRARTCAASILAMRAASASWVAVAAAAARSSSSIFACCKPSVDAYYPRRAGRSARDGRLGGGVRGHPVGAWAERRGGVPSARR